MTDENKPDLRHYVTNVAPVARLDAITYENQQMQKAKQSQSEKHSGGHSFQQIGQLLRSFFSFEILIKLGFGAAKL